MLRAARETYARIEGRAAPFYGLASALGVALPLLVGALTGRAAQGSVVALGAYLVAFTAPSGPYGARARALATTVAVVSLGATFGGLLVGRPWPAVAVVPVVVALGVAVPWIGPTAGLSVLLTAVRPPADSLLYNGFLELLGGLLVSALFLAAWPVRRLRPLREALAEVANAVAVTLDAVAQDIGAGDDAALRAVDLTDPDLAAVALKPDWREQRRAASSALIAARRTYALYRADRAGDERPTQPERLIEALARILHETVTLRAQIEALGRAASPPAGQRGWELDVRVAITALAARLRLLAGAVADTRPTPLGSTDSAAVRRLAKQSERIWRAGQSGDGDVVAAALVGQVRRSIDRIAGTVESARRLASDDLRLGPRPPWQTSRDHRSRPWPARPEPPWAGWRRLERAARTRSPMFRQVTRVGLIVAVAMAIAAALRVPHGHWLTITVLLSLRGTYGETVARVVQRIAGTAIGAVLAAVLLALVTGQVAAALILFVCALLGFTLRSVNYGYWALFGTPLVMMLLDFSTPADWTAAGIRIGLTIAGGLLALLAARLLWPAGTAQLLPGRLARLLSAHAELARSAAAVVDGAADGLPRDRFTAAERATDEVADARDRLAHEPLPAPEQIALLRTSVRAAQQVRDHLIAVTRMSREDIDDTGPIAGILDRVADHLDEVAGAISAEEREPAAGDRVPALDLTDRLADLDDHLAALARRRRTELSDGAAADETTPLRRALLQAAGVRYTLRALRSDAESLGESALAVTAEAPKTAS